jgi:hypothetical protein
MMSVDRTDYLMFGADVGTKEFDWDKHEAEIEGAEGRRFDIVYDGMSGKYCIAGKIIAKSEPYEGIEMVKIDPAKIEVDRSALAAVVSDAFGRDVSEDDFSLILFSHFS